jgi:predicted transposase YbfD/YdcC
VGVKPEVRYFVSSLDLSDWTPGEILAFIRHHWSIENSLHFVKDRWRDEDKHYFPILGSKNPRL